MSKAEKNKKESSSRFIIIENSKETDNRDYIKSKSISFCIVKKK